MSNPDTYTEVTQRSWGSKIAGSLLGVVLAPLLIIGSSVALFWNEGRAVQTARSLTEGAAVVIDIDPTPVNAANEGRLVHVTGDLKAGAKLTDPDFGVVSDAVRMKRFVEMYQWKEESRSETRKTAGGGEETVTTYTYRKEWSGKAIDSSRFKQPGLHANPPMRFADRDILADDATLGAFRAGAPVLRAFDLSHKLEVDPAVADTARKTAGRPASVAIGQIYISRNPGSPEIGDYRISYRMVPSGTASVVAQQNGGDLTGYQSKAGDVILLAQTGTVGAAEMFKAAQDSNRVLTWILRGVFTMIMLIGFVFFTGPLVAIADFIPFLGRIVQASSILIGVLLTAVLAPLIIAVAWLFYRPLISGVALATGLAVAYAIMKLMEMRKARPAQAKPALAESDGGMH